MKRTTFFLLLGLAGLLIVGSFFFCAKTTSKKILRIYSWSQYFPDDKIKIFEGKNNLAVEISYFSSNEELYAKMVAGASGYDIVIPSDYMVTRMITRKMLTPLDKEKLPRLRNLKSEFFEATFDPGLKYSVPYTNGYTGILVNTDAIKIESNEISWSLLLESQDPNHSSLLDDMREVLAAMLLSNGHNPNERDLNILNSMKEKLIQTKEKITLFSSEPAALAIRGELNICHAYTSHAIQATAENPSFRFFFPKEGVITWTDNFAIPKDSAHVAEAHAFIDFFLESENALAATRTNGLATPNREAWLLLSPKEQSNPILYPSLTQKRRLHYLEDLRGDDLQTVNRLWTEMKLH